MRRVRSDPGPGLVIESWGSTDVGMTRRLNEDVFLVDENLSTWSPTA
jgi:hypothetical protein